MDIKTRVTSVLKFLANQKYELDVYQRGYVWTDGEIRKFLTDLEDHARDWLNMDHPPSWFLGTVLVEKRGGRNFLVDGQQRLVTLGLLLLALYPMASGPRKTGIQNALKGDDQSLALPLAVGRYQLTFAHLARGTTPDRLTEHDPDQQRIAAAFYQISDWVKISVKPDDEQAFVDAVLKLCLLNVVQVSDTHLAFRLFNSLNSRGKPLSVVDTLKSVLLTNVAEAEREAIAQAWDAARSEATKDGATDPTLGALRSTLIARAAPETGPGAAFASSHEVRLIRDNPFEWLASERPGGPPAEHIARELPFFIRLDGQLALAARTPTPGLDALHFAEAVGVPHDHWAPLIMAPLSDPSARGDVNARMVSVVLTFIDIVAARLAWRRLAYSPAQVRDALAGIAPLIRDAGPETLSFALSALLEGHFPERFDAHPALNVGGEGLSRRAAHALLARMTAHVETLTEKPSGEYADFVGSRYRVMTTPAVLPVTASGRAAKDPIKTKRARLGAHILVLRRLGKAMDAEPDGRKPVTLAQADNRLALTAAEKAPVDPTYDQARTTMTPPLPDGPVRDGVDIALRDDAYAALARAIWSPERLHEAADTVHPELPKRLTLTRPTADTPVGGPSRPTVEALADDAKQALVK